MSTTLPPVLARIDADLNASIDRLCALLRIPSVSTDPRRAGDVKRAAQWCADQLREIGFRAEVCPTTGHPMVVAEHDAAKAGAPTVLYYGHYDVQPEEPVEQWSSPPFEPTIVEGPLGKRVVARGAVDDKGQVMTFIEAFRAWKAVHGSLPINVRVMLEGEEESGSPSLNPFLEANKERLKADVCIVCDTGMWDIETPAITYMLRGLVYAEVTLIGPGHDLHSGMYGGTVPNPNNMLAKAIAELHDADRRVQLAGFYDDVRELSGDEKAQWSRLGFDDAEFLASAGLKQALGEKGRTVLERVWARPTCDVNGMWGGYTGAGAKTVIPAQASAKLSCRLVADQDPARVKASIVQFFESRTPPGCRWEFKWFGADRAIRVPTESRWLTLARGALQRVFGREAMLIGSGGSIPVVGSFQRILNLQSLLIGFGLDDDRVHSPNEKFEIRCLHNGIRSHAAVMDAFSAGG